MSTDFGVGEDVGRLSYLLKRAENLMHRACDEVLRDLGLTTPKYLVLRILKDSPDLSAAQLARRSFVTPQTMSTMVASLAQRALIARTAHPENARVLLNRLTSEGKEVEAEGRLRIATVEARMREGIEPAEEAAYRDVLRRSADTLTDRPGLVPHWLGDGSPATLGIDTDD